MRVCALSARCALACGSKKLFLFLLLLTGMISNTAFAVDLFDNFDRADSADLGNGWVEKQPAAFSLVGGEAVKQAVTTGYLNNVAYRPAAENTLDTESSIEFRLTSTNIGYPQIFVRLQSDVSTPDVLTGYILFISNNATQAVLRRQSGYGYQYLDTVYLSQALNQTDTYRMRLRATGTNPVQLNAYIERDNAGSWEILGQTGYSDTDAARIATAGAVGFGGYVEASYVYDNFRRLDLDGTGPADNPVPVATSVAPNSATAGSGALAVTVNGSDFIPGSVVRWNGADRVTTFISATQLEADIAAADLSTAGTANITVFNPAPGGGVSAALAFTINEATGNPIPVTNSISPNTATEGGSAFLLTVNGSGFVPGATVRWNGADRTTNFVSASQLEANIDAADIAAAGNATVTVLNPAPGGGISNSQTFTIDPLVVNNPVPAIVSLNPASVTEGSPAFTLQVNGSDFVAGAVVRWNGLDLTSTFISATVLEAAVSATDVASAGTANITVFNPAPGGGVSAISTFTIDASVPTLLQSLNSISPNAATAGDGNTVITLYGTGFSNASVAQFNGTALTTTYVSNTQLTATIAAASLVDASRSAITVNTPEADNTISDPVPFYVVETGDVLFTDDFNRADSADVGNEWTEKLPSAFSLNNGRITSVDSTPRGFNNNIVYRPAAQDGANTEVGMEFIRTNSSDPRFPQVHLRALRDNITEPDALISYTAFIYDENPVTLNVTTIWDFQECYLGQFPLSEPLILGDRYRLRFRVVGVNPIRLSANLDHFVTDQWQNIATGSMIHDDNTQPIPGAWCSIGYMPPPSMYDHSGAVGFAKYIYQTDEYDNFYSIQLASDANEAPAISSLQPASAPVGSSSFPLTVNGGGYMPGSIVRWNGVDLPTTYVSPTELQASIDASLLALPATADVTVFSPPPGGGESNVQTFTVASVGGDLMDDFQRPDGATIGNGWIEKQAGAFSLANGEAAKNSTSSGYLDNIVYRPASEDVLNVEASAELRFNTSIWGYPQILVRVQGNSVATNDRLDGYILYVNNNDSQLILGRQRDNSFVVPLSSIYLGSPLDISSVFRMRLRATGTNPVTVSGYLDRMTASGWATIGQASVIDNSPERISTPGSVGFGGYVNGTYSYDNFLRTNLGE